MPVCISCLQADGLSAFFLYCRLYLPPSLRCLLAFLTLSAVFHFICQPFSVHCLLVSFSLCFHLSLCLSVCLSFSVSLSVCLSFSIFVFLSLFVCRLSWKDQNKFRENRNLNVHIFVTAHRNLHQDANI